MKLKNIFRLTRNIILFIVVYVFLLTVFINVYMILYSMPYITKNFEDVREKYTVIVPGAMVYRNNVSHVVRDRLEGASELVQGGKVKKVLISGDHGTKYYDEVNTMRKFMQSNYRTDGDIIFMDHAGFSTYETMYRARDIFCVKDCVVVTQKFHLPRAVYIGRKLGLDVSGYVAKEITPFRTKTKVLWFVREYFARLKSFFLVMFEVPPTYLGDKIPVTGDSRLSWE